MITVNFKQGRLIGSIASLLVGLLVLTACGSKKTSSVVGEAAGDWDSASHPSTVCQRLFGEVSGRRGATGGGVRPSERY